MLRISLLLLSTLASVVTLQLKDRYTSKSETERTLRYRPDDGMADAQPVFYTIVMGDLVHRHQVTLWLASLRNIGRFQGEVVIVTDRPRCIEKTLEDAGLLGDEQSSSDEVDIFYPKPGFEGSLHILKRPSAKGSTMMMKAEKARAFANIRNAGIPYHVSTVIYTDQDFIFGQDINSFVSNIYQVEKAKQHLLGLFQDEGDDLYHTSVVVMFAGQRTEKCLDEWSQWFKTNDGKETAESTLVDQAEDSETLGPKEIQAMEKESKALTTLDTCNKAGGINTLRRGALWLPTNSGMKDGKRAEFIHFSSTDRWPVENELIKHSKSASWNARQATTRQYLHQLGIPGEVDPFAITISDFCPIKNNNGVGVKFRAADTDIPRASTKLNLPEINI